MKQHIAQKAILSWSNDGAPFCERFQDLYFSKNDGLAETRHVFLKGNHLPERFLPGFHIAELGFGTGLNLLAAWALWEQSGIQGQLCFTSFEAFPMSKQEMAKALRHWPELGKPAARLLDVWQPETTMEVDSLQLRIIYGDVNETLQHWPQKADAWFLDGFSPAKNPDIWSGPVLNEVAKHTKTGGSFATYTAAGHVRTKLQSAGFEVQRMKGHGTKRHMTVGRLRDAE